MLDKILVALDGSELSDRILIHVRRLLHAVDADVTLLRVVAVAAEADDARNHLDQIRNVLVEEGARATTRVMVGDPAARIVDAAEEIDPSCIAMATHGRTGVAHALFGSTCERVLARSRWPLLVANPFALQGADSLRMKRILVPLDGTEGSAEIVPAAGEIARLHGAELVILVALPGEDGAGAPPQRYAGALVRDQLGALAGLPATVRIERGAPVEKILDAISEEPIDLVAMASSGRGTVDKWLHGSVSESIIRRCRCPVLIARAGSGARSLTRSQP